MHSQLTVHKVWTTVFPVYTREFASSKTRGLHMQAQPEPLATISHGLEQANFVPVIRTVCILCNFKPRLIFPRINGPIVGYDEIMILKYCNLEAAFRMS